MVFELQAGNIADNVALLVPMVDRGRGPDPRNILGVVIDKNENKLYTIATRHGILSNKYTQPTSLCRQQLLKDSDINRDKRVSLREALKCTTYGGQ